jgi:hypothetical protein
VVKNTLFRQQPVNRLTDPKGGSIPEEPVPEATAMGRPIITDKPKPLLGIVEPRTRRRISPEEKETGLGPERVASIPADASPLSAFALHQSLFCRLRSIGGRPGLDGADMNPKSPMRRSSWKKSEQNAGRVETTDFHPTPAQLASVILDATIDRLCADADTTARPRHT